MTGKHHTAATPDPAEDGPSDEDVRLLQALHRGGHGKAAVVHAFRLIKAWPTYAPAWSVLVGNLAAEKEQQKALDVARAGLRSLPGNPTLLVYRAILLHNLGRAEEAETAYRAVLRAEPGNVPARNNLGDMLLKSGRKDEAMAILADDASTSAEAGVLRFTLGRLHLAANEVREAAAEFRRAIALSPRLGLAYIGLSIALQADELLHDGAVASERAVALRPESPSAQNAAGAAAYARGLLGNAGRYFRNAIALKPSEPRTYLHLHIVAVQEEGAGGADSKERWKHLDPALDLTMVAPRAWLDEGEGAEAYWFLGD